MSAKKPFLVTVAVLLTAMIGFCTYWTAINAKTLGAFFAGEKVTYNSQLAPEREYYQSKIKELGDLVSDFEFKLSEALTSGATKDVVIESFTAQVSALQINALSLSAQVSEQIALNEKLSADNQEFSFLLIQVQKQLLGYVAMIGRLHDLVVYLSDTLTAWDGRTECLVTFYVDGHVWDLQVINHINTKLVEPSVPVGDFMFLGWSLDGKTIIDPTQVLINSDIEFYAVCVSSFTADSEVAISKVVEAVKAGADPMNFPYRVGDKRDIQLDTGEVITFEILGIQHDDLADGSGKAPYTLGMENLLQTEYRMNSTRTNVGSWNESEMRNSTLQMIFSQLPMFWQNLIKTVTKKTTIGNGGSEIPATAIQTSQDRLFLFSEVEIAGDGSVGSKDEGEQYEYWRTIKNGSGDSLNNSDCMKYRSNGMGSVGLWALRSPTMTVSTSFRNINIKGGRGGSTFADGLSCVCFGFCV